MSSTVLEARGLSKAFGHVQAIHDVSLRLDRGEILVLVGDNGAGKSTLIKILSGLYAPDAGTIHVDGVSRQMDSPADAVKSGIATVYQDLALVDTRDVAQNLYLGNEFTVGPFVDRLRGIREATSLLEKLRLPIPASGVTVDALSGGQRQAVAVARTLVTDPRVVIMDEPTAALGVTESSRVMELAVQLRDEGRGVLIISHNLQQVWNVADRIMVLRLGRMVGVRERRRSSIDEIVQLIVAGEPEE
jgi:ABC-type sugar transport system ATPase subunit